MTGFVHLRSHSHFCVDEGLISPGDLVTRAAEDNQPAIALTDTNMFGVIPFYQAARKKGVKPIIGLDAWIEPDVTEPFDSDSPNTTARPTPSRLLLLCTSTTGYRKLMSWLSRAYRENQQSGKPCLKQSWFESDGTDGLIALSGDFANGVLARSLGLAADAVPVTPPAIAAAQGTAVVTDNIPTHVPAAALNDTRQLLQVYARWFPERFFLEVQRAGQANEAALVSATVDLSAQTNMPLVATHPIQFDKRSDFYAHEVRVAVAEKDKMLNKERPIRHTREQGFQTSAQMAELFADLPEAVANAAALAQRCSMHIDLGKVHLPDFPTPNGEPLESYLSSLAHEGLEARLVALYPDLSERDRERPRFLERLATELKVINTMGFAGYFLIVSDFINWAKGNGIIVGPGRGSGAGSLAAYALRITDIEPMRYDLLFERFLNPDRVSMPDFDIDFDIDRRGEVIDYVRNKYGEQSVSQISTVMTMAAKGSIHDVGRAMGYHPFSTKTLADLVPKVLDITLEDALFDKAHSSPKLKEKYDEDPSLRKLLDVAVRLSGTPRAVGKHAAGVLIAPGPITDFSPLYVDDDGSAVSQYDKDDVEKAGLIKFDFLGLMNLTVIQKAVDRVNARPERDNNPLDITSLSPDDPKVYESLSAGQTMGVFQLEGAGMTKLVTQLKPDNFEDLIALLALYRPGPLNSGMVKNYVDRKHGRATVDYPHPLLEEVLRPTYGVMVYQEQVMQAARILANYSLGGADLLRRAMGKKKPEEMAKERSKFETGAAENGIDPDQARHVFDLMEKFAEYGFNKSHSAAYAMVSYQTAWLKTHYPAEYFAAFMDVVSAGTKQDKLELLVKDARALGLEMLPPDINQADANFTVATPTAIRYGLIGLKGVGVDKINAIITARQEKGAFVSLADFCVKVGRSMANKTVVEALIRTGAFDELHPNRAALMAAVPEMLAYAAKKGKQAQAEATVLLPDLFGSEPVSKTGKSGRTARRKTKATVDLVEPPLPETPGWTDLQTLQEEKRVVGFYLSGHPFDGFKASFGGLPMSVPLSNIDKMEPSETVHVVAGVVARVKPHTTARGTMGFLSIDDGEKEKDITLFVDQYEPNASWLKPGAFAVFEARIQADRRGGDYGNELKAEAVYSSQQIQQRQLDSIDVMSSADQWADALEPVIDRHRCGDGEHGIRLRLNLPHARLPGHVVRFSPTPKLRPSDDLLADIRQAVGDCRVIGNYKPNWVVANPYRGARKRRGP